MSEFDTPTRKEAEPVSPPPESKSASSELSPEGQTRMGQDAPDVKPAEVPKEEPPAPQPEPAAEQKQPQIQPSADQKPAETPQAPIEKKPIPPLSPEEEDMLNQARAQSEEDYNDVQKDAIDRYTAPRPAYLDAEKSKVNDQRVQDHPAAGKQVSDQGRSRMGTDLNPEEEAMLQQLRQQREAEAAQARAENYDRATTPRPAYMNFSDTKAPTDQVQIEKAAAELKNADNLKEANWAKLDDAGKLAEMQKVENLMANIQKREPLTVKAVSMEEGYEGGYNGDGFIYMNEKTLSTGKPAENLDTILHEGRHAYQDKAIQSPDSHPNPQQVKGWQRNKEEGYKDPRIYGERIYRNQPIEADAFNYAGAIRENLYGKGA